MSTGKLPAGPRKPAGPAAKNAPAPRRATPIAPGRPARQGGRDLFGLYFILGAAGFILLFGATIWGLRNANHNSAAALANATVVPTAAATVAANLLTVVPPVDTPPLANFTPAPTAALIAPDALRTGALVMLTPVTSVVSDLLAVEIPPHLPPQIPQARLSVSTDHVDLGLIRPGQVLSRELSLANPGVGEVLIRNLVSDCPCLTARAAAGRLRSNTRTPLLLSYDAHSDPVAVGPITHTLSLISTDGQQPRTDITVTLRLP